MELEILKRMMQIDNLYSNQKVNVDDYVKEIKYDENAEKVVLLLAALGDDLQKNKAMEREIIKICKIELGIKGVKISYMPSEEQGPQKSISENTKIIAVSSGKGGVGKSNVAMGLSDSLQALGYKVGVIDADIYGYSIPVIADAIEEPKVIDGKIKPVVAENGIEMISAQHFLPNTENKAIIWRGVKLNSLLTHFVYDVIWDKNLDYMVIDMPPGTGDVLLNINNLFEEVNSLYVTTPSSDAAYVAERVIQVGNELGFKNIGLVENMAYYQVDGEKHYIFGQDGAKMISDKYEMPILSSIPITKGTKEYYEQLAKAVSELI